MGPALCLLSAVCFGAMAVFGKLAYDAGVTPQMLLLVRFALAALLLAPVVLVRSRRTALPLRLVLTALGLGAIGYAAQSTFYFSALQLMDATPLTLIFYTYPLLVTVAAAVIGRERLTRSRVGALAVASGGTVLVVVGAGGSAGRPLGMVLGFAAALTYTCYILVSDTVVGRVPPVLLSVLVMTGASVTLGAQGLATGALDVGFAPVGWVWLVCIAVVSTVLAMLAFFAGLRRTGPSTAAIVSTAEPVVTTALAAAVLGEHLTPLQLVGGGLVLASVVLVQVRTSARPVAAVVEHPLTGPCGAARSAA